MSSEYCEKHEWPAGMGNRCPDCIEIEFLKAEIAKNRAERDAALLQVEKLKDKYETCEQCDGSTDAGVFCVPCWNRVNLQVGELKKALYAECRGEACNPDECHGGYRQCTGCEVRAKKAYGPGWGGVVEKPIEGT